MFDSAMHTVRVAAAGQRHDEIEATGESVTPEFPVMVSHELRYSCSNLAIAGGANINVLRRLIGHKKVLSVPEIISFARYPRDLAGPDHRRLQTGVARAQSHNRIVKHVRRIAFSFRNADNRRRRVRWAHPRADHAESHPAGTNATAKCEATLFTGTAPLSASPTGQANPDDNLLMLAQQALARGAATQSWGVPLLVKRFHRSLEPIRHQLEKRTRCFHPRS